MGAATDPESDLRRPLDDAVAFATRALGACGVPDAEARTAAAALVRADARGVRTHGLALLPLYVRSLREGHTDPAARTLIEDRGDHLLVDAENGLGHVAAARVLDHAVRAGRTRAVVAVSIRRVGHLGALGVQVLAAAEQGFVALLAQNTQPLIGLDGSTAPGIGNNPFAFAVPLAGRAPLVFDAAMSAVSLSRVRQYARDGLAMPPGWALDGEGRPTADADEAAVLLPFGGYKGIALAMLFETLAGSLGGMRPTPTGGLPVGNGAFLLLLDPGRFIPAADFDAHVDAWIGTYLAANPGARIPGDQAGALEAACRRAGLVIPAAHRAALDALAETLDIARL